MSRTARILAALALAAVGAAAAASAQPARTCCNSPGLTPSGPKAGDPEFKDLPRAGEKCRIGEVNYFVYEFDKSLKTGTVILKVRIFNRDGEPVSDLGLTGRSDMPSMRGSHDSGDVSFKLSQQGDYLLPINITMPGDWEVLLTFSRNKIVIFRGRIIFGV